MSRSSIWAFVLLALLVLAGCVEDPPVNLCVDDDPTVTLKVWFKTGSQDDPAGKEGLAYLTAQLIAEGSTTENAYEEILEKLYPMAAGYRVQVDREMTVLSGRVHGDNFEPYLALYTDAVLRPAFNDEDFARVKSDTLNSLRDVLRYQADEELAKAALYGFVFEGTRYAHPSLGTVNGVESITVEDVREFYRTRYTRGNAVLALGGGFDDGLPGRLQGALGELPEGAPAPVTVPRAAEIEGLQVLLVSKPEADASISFGFPIEPLRGERQFYALWIANSWLGEHRSSASHLYQVIREARGMNYGDYSYIEAFPQGGRRNVPPNRVGRQRQIFEVWIRTLPAERAHFALRAAMRELDGLIARGMSEEEFELTRSFLRKYVLHFADTTSARLGYRLDDQFYGVEGEGHLSRFRRMMDEITLDEVNEALRTHLQTRNVKIVVVTGQAERLKEALVNDTPSPVVYETAKPQAILDEDKIISTYPLAVSADAVRIVPVEAIFEQ